jgi:predicted transcriptional regulator
MSAADPVAKQLHDLLADWHFRNGNLLPLGRVDADLYRRVGEVLRDVLCRQNEMLLTGVTDERHYNDLHEARIEIYRDLLDETNGKPPAEPPCQQPDVQLTDNDERVLLYLLEMHPRLRFKVDVATGADISEETARKLLDRLRDAGLVHRPKGPRKGIGLTDKGRQLAQRLQKHRPA